jgi:hypothetical protein
MLKIELYNHDNMVIRRLASLPMPKSRSRISCDINWSKNTSHHPRHPHHCRCVRAKATDSIHRALRAIWRGRRLSRSFGGLKLFPVQRSLRPWIV